MKQQTLTNVPWKSATKTNEFHLFMTFGRHGGQFRTRGASVREEHNSANFSFRQVKQTRVESGRIEGYRRSLAHM